MYTDGGTRVSEGETSACWSAVAPSPDGRLQGGGLALGPFRLKTRNGSPFGTLFRSEWAPLGGQGDPNFNAGARFRALSWFELPFLKVSKHQSWSVK